MSVRNWLLSALPLVVLVILLFLGRNQPPPLAERSSPGSMKEVMAIARKLGLHYRSDRADGIVETRLVISDFPLEWERANTFVMRRVNEADSSGVVGVLREVRGLTLMPDKRLERWGEFFLCGDPALIARLTATAAAE